MTCSPTQKKIACNIRVPASVKTVAFEWPVLHFYKVFGTGCTMLLECCTFLQNNWKIMEIMMGDYTQYSYRHEVLLQTSLACFYFFQPLASHTAADDVIHPECDESTLQKALRGHAKAAVERCARPSKKNLCYYYKENRVNNRILVPPVAQI